MPLPAAFRGLNMFSVKNSLICVCHRFLTFSSVCSESKCDDKSSLPKIISVNDDEIDSTVQAGDTSKDAHQRKPPPNQLELRFMRINTGDESTRNPVYKLMTRAEYDQEHIRQEMEQLRLENKEHVKGAKVLLLDARMPLSELDRQLEIALKWLNQFFAVHVIISGNSAPLEKIEKLCDHFEDCLRSHNIHNVCKRFRGADVMLEVIPPKDRTSESKSGSDNELLTESDK